MLTSEIHLQPLKSCIVMLLRIFLGNHMKAYPTFSTSFESVSLPDSTHIVAMQCVLSCLSKPCIKAHKIFHQNRSSRF